MRRWITAALLLLAGCGSGGELLSPAPEEPRLAVLQATNATLALKAGWTPVAFKGSPLQTLNAPPAVIGMAWCVNGTYQTARFSQSELNRLGSAQGYWLYANSACNVSYTAADVYSQRLVLEAGWNLVSFPSPTPIPFYVLDVRRSSWPVAASEVLLRTFLQVNPDGTTTAVNISSTGALNPGFPYWVYALEEISLEYSLPSPSPSTQASPSPSPRPSPSPSPRPSPAASVRS